MSQDILYNSFKKFYLHRIINHYNMSSTMEINHAPKILKNRIDCSNIYFFIHHPTQITIPIKDFNISIGIYSPIRNLIKQLNNQKVGRVPTIKFTINIYDIVTFAFSMFIMINIIFYFLES